MQWNTKKRSVGALALLAAFCAAVVLSGCSRRIGGSDALTEIALADTGALSDDAPSESGETPGEEAAESAKTLNTAESEATDGSLPDASRTDASGDSARECYIHIYGAVRNPGVYRMEQGDRIFQAVARAGGFADDACEDYVNQAKSVADGLKIWIPTKREAEERRRQGAETAEDGDAGLFYPRPEPETAATADVLIDLNAAGERELCLLPGIGEAKARAIIAYREENGGFSSPEEIMKVTGIKQNGYDKIKDRITVR